MQPTPGTIYAETNNPAARYIVENVATTDDGFFLVEIVVANEAGDISATREEYDPAEWANWLTRHRPMA